MSFLQGDRIYLRALELSDVTERYYAWMNDREIGKYMESWHWPHSTDNIMAYVKDKASNRNEPFFAIILKKGIYVPPNGFNEDQHIGNIKLGPIDWIHRRADIGLFIGEKNLQKQGYGSEAIGVLCTYGFNVLGLHKLTAGIYSENYPSYKAFVKNGFFVEAELKEHIFYMGQWRNVTLLGKLNRDT